MCEEFSGDEFCQIWDVTYQVARKEHTCCGCKETISPRQRYCKTVTMYEGSWEVFKNCLRCATMIEALKRRMGSYTTEIHYLNCGEVWDDPPADVAALAFALPRDFAVSAEVST